MPTWNNDYLYTDIYIAGRMSVVKLWWITSSHTVRFCFGPLKLMTVIPLSWRVISGCLFDTLVVDSISGLVWDDTWIFKSLWHSLTSPYVLWYLPPRASIASWISNHVPSKMWDEITYPFTNFNSCTIEVWQEISNFITHFIIYAINYLCCI